MGQVVSSRIASYLQEYTVDQLLGDEEFLDSMKAAILSLSPRSQENLSALSSRRALKKTVESLGVPKLRPISMIQHSDIALPEAIREPFFLWQLDWTLLFNDDENTDVNLLKKDTLQALSTAYSSVLNLEKRRVIDRIRWRFYTLFFFDLYWLKNQQTYFTPSGFRTIVDAIDIRGNRQEIEQNLHAWVSCGRRYRNLCSAIGDSGCLFLLPEAVSDILWEKYLPLKGPSFLATIERLKTLGINEKSQETGARRVAQSIEQGLLNSFRWEVETNRVEQIASRSRLSCQTLCETEQISPSSDQVLSLSEPCDHSSSLLPTTELYNLQYEFLNTVYNQNMLHTPIEEGALSQNNTFLTLHETTQSSTLAGPDMLGNSFECGSQNTSLGPIFTTIHTPQGCE